MEPNNNPATAQQISLPCDIAGSFYPAADVDTYEFTAKKGEIWWVELASERLGSRPDERDMLARKRQQRDHTLLGEPLISDASVRLRAPEIGHYRSLLIRSLDRLESGRRSQRRITPVRTQHQPALDAIGAVRDGAGAAAI